MLWELEGREISQLPVFVREPDEHPVLEEEVDVVHQILQFLFAHAALVVAHDVCARCWDFSGYVVRYLSVI